MRRIANLRSLKIYDGYIEKYKCEEDVKLTEKENVVNCENVLHGAEIPCNHKDRLYRHEAGHLLILFLHYESLGVFPALVSLQKRENLNAYIKVVDIKKTNPKKEEEKFKSWILYSVAGKAAEAILNGTEKTAVYLLLKRLHEKKSRDLEIARHYASKLSDNETRQEEIIVSAFHQAISELKANRNNYSIILEVVKNSKLLTPSGICELFKKLEC